MSLDIKIGNIVDWWRKENKESFIKFADILVDHGFSEDEAVEFLDDCYHAVASEYGD